ncbi:uncharacterized protein LOC143539785 [Bidens hawaiensis]|uniref:uncharacterized protein LOC143539785 n=1 Tax=Bidens hawaiensis TaxID=980011 RepID=UPI00404A8D8D
MKVYPKVKVVIQEEEYDDPPRVYLKDLQPPSLYDHPSTQVFLIFPRPCLSIFLDLPLSVSINVTEHKDGYTPPYVRVPISSSGMGKVNRKVAQSNSKSSTVLPPRAVISSPENDTMLGTKTKNKTKIQEAGLKDHNSCQNRHVKCTKSYELEKKKRALLLIVIY